jgi:hypothetical protein
LTGTVKAYKFLRPGAVGPFSGFQWPVEAWVEADEATLCANGVHACRVEHLPYWIGAELWEVELDGAREEYRKLVAARGRLIRRVEAWDDGARAGFAHACAARVRERADEATPERAAQLAEYAADAAANAARGEVAVLGYIAARAAEVDAGAEGYAAEREAQAGWLASRLRLDAT